MLNALPAWLFDRAFQAIACAACLTTGGALLAFVSSQIRRTRTPDNPPMAAVALRRLWRVWWWIVWQMVAGIALLLFILLRPT